MYPFPWKQLDRFLLPEIRREDGISGNSTRIIFWPHHWHERDTIEEQQLNLEGMTSWLDKIMEEACDAAAPRVGPKKPKRQAYWWNPKAASLRHDCIRARRTWQRARRRRRPEEQVQELGDI